MRTALKLQHILHVFVEMEHSADSTYDTNVEELEDIPRQFALDLMRSCITPSEVINLMQGADHSMMEDVLKSQNKELIALKFYQKMIWNNFWGCNDKSKRFKMYVFWELPFFFFCNVIYGPLTFFLTPNKLSKMRKDFFTPFASYFADILNYTILLLLLYINIVTTTPDPKAVYSLIKGYYAGNIDDENPRIREIDYRTVQFQLSAPTIPFSEWVLWVCLLGRILTECYQVGLN